MKKLAVFDIDGTLFRSSLLIELTNALVEDNLFPKTAKKEIEKEYKSWAYREGSYEDYIKKVIDVYLKNIVGIKEDDVVRNVDRVLKDEKKKLYKYTRSLIERLKEKDFFLFAISGSPGHILTTFAKDIGFDKYLGGYFEVENGRFTGKQPYGNPADDKKKTLEEFINNSNQEFDLENSVGIGDTESDVSFLEMIGNPIAFNPNRKLLDKAIENEWMVVVERKDVVYELSKFNILDVD